MVRFTLSPQRTDTQRAREDHPFHVSKLGYETIPLLSKTKIQAISHLFCAWFVWHLVRYPSRFSHDSFFGLRLYFPSQQFFSHVRTFSWFEVVLSNVDEVSLSRTQHFLMMQCICCVAMTLDPRIQHIFSKDLVMKIFLQPFFLFR